jgi:hypothetical protein
MQTFSEDRQPNEWIHRNLVGRKKLRALFRSDATDELSRSGCLASDSVDHSMRMGQSGLSTKRVVCAPNASSIALSQLDEYRQLRSEHHAGS